MDFCAYLDESGDTGWIFNLPYQRGGSSRYLSIGYIILPQELKHLPKKIIKRFNLKFKINPFSELKGSHLYPDRRIYFANQVINLLEITPLIKIGVITVYKPNVAAHIRNDSNKLYNYMVNLAISDKIKSADKVFLNWDERTLKVKSGNSLTDYLQIKLWFELNSGAVIVGQSCKSHEVRNILFIDWLTHIVWSYYENGNINGFSILNRKIELLTLFFS
jgi:capsule polysaccharide export protein KpsE/RkpR